MSADDIASLSVSKAVSDSMPISITEKADDTDVEELASAAAAEQSTSASGIKSR